MAGLQSVTNALNGLTDSFVHPSLRREPDILHRTRVLIALVLFINMVVAISSVVTAVVYTSPQTRTIGAAICLALIAGNFLLLYLLRSHGNLVWCSLAVALLAAVGIVFGIMLSGGILRSPVTQLLAMPPLMAYFFAGRRRGTYSVLVALAVISLLTWAQYTKVIVPARLDMVDADIARILLAVLGVTAVSAMALIFELNASKLKRERDVEHRKMLLLAQTDGLTGLANRRSFDAQLNLRIGDTPAVGGFALCFIDLDGFKDINDRFGHAIGDEVLCAVAQRLRQSARDHDVVGRQGGDEFTLIFDALTDPEALLLKINRMLTSITEPIETSASVLSVGASIGVALYPQHGTTAEMLKKAADQAMYAAKQERNQWRVYEPRQC